MMRRLLSPAWVVILLSLWMAGIGNAALWRRLSTLGALEGAQGWLLGAGMLGLIWGALIAILALFAWRLTLKPVAVVLLLVCAVASHFMLAYGIAIDIDMITNVLQTDVREAGALFNWKLVATVAVVGVLPIALLFRTPVVYATALRQGLRNLLLLAVGIATLVAAVMLSFQPFASVMRNHKDVRYLINPLATVYSLGWIAAKPLQRDNSKLVAIGQDARLAPPPADANSAARPSLLLVVLGETARSANFGLNGYTRDTTPRLAAEQAVSFRNAWSCGTSTAASVPCMFSNLGRDHFEDRKNQFEGLMDVLQRAGLAVLWLDNQSGCKGVCDRVPNASTAETKTSPFCTNGECLDEVMLEGLDQRIAALDPEKVKRGVVVVMHQMGSHGPAYYLRSPKSIKRYMPECMTSSLQDCSRDEVVNAYDNSIAYTDHFLGESIRWLKSREATSNTAMLYLSDHGESLGEKNLFLHGMPYAIAPDFQKHIPWVTWASPGFQQARGLAMDCLKSAADKRVSHDNFFHSVLGLMGVQTSVYVPSLDAYAACSKSPGASQPR